MGFLIDAEIRGGISTVPDTESFKLGSLQSRSTLSFTEIFASPLLETQERKKTPHFLERVLQAAVKVAQQRSCTAETRQKQTTTGGKKRARDDSVARGKKKNLNGFSGVEM